MKSVFVLKESKDRRRVEFFDLNTQENGKSILYFVYRILSFKRAGRLYIFFDFGVGLY